MADIRHTIASAKAGEIEFLLTDFDAAVVFLGRARHTTLWRNLRTGTH
jgi:hypothetical protein